MALVKPMEKKLEAVRKKFAKELKSPALSKVQKNTLKRDITALNKIIATMKAGAKKSNHTIC